MSEPKNNEPLIKPEDILIKGQEVSLKTIVDLAEHIKKRNGLFMSRLAAIATRIYGGWLSISQDQEGKIVKQPVGPFENALFTGKNFCQLGAYALEEGLSRLNKEDKFGIKVVELDTDQNAENWDRKDYQGKPAKHDIVQVTEKHSGEVVYFDPTYGQVNHTRSGEIVIIKETDINRFYKGKGEDMKDTIVDISSRKPQFLKLATAVGIPLNQYNLLVDTISSFN